MIIRKFKKLEAKKLVPCNCNRCVNSTDPNFYSWEDLQNLLNAGVQSCHCPKSVSSGEHKVSYADIAKLLGEYGRVSREETDKDKIPNEKFYIEHAHFGEIARYIKPEGDYVYGTQNKTGNVMKIDKQVNKNVKAVMNADEINIQKGLDENAIREIVNAIGELSSKEKELLKDYYQQLNSVKGKNTESERNMSKKISTFLVNSGIAIAQSLTASGIYDVCTRCFA